MAAAAGRVLAQSGAPVALYAPDGSRTRYGGVAGWERGDDVGCKNEDEMRWMGNEMMMRWRSGDGE